VKSRLKIMTIYLILAFVGLGSWYK